jgi:predicted PurR-regulated permease PerM
MQKDYFGVLKVTLLVVAVAIIPFLIWYLFGVVMMIFGAVILAMLLRLGARPFIRWFSFPEAAALAVSGMVVLVVVGGAAYLFGTHIAGEFQDVAERASEASAGIQRALRSSEFGSFLLDHLGVENFSAAAVLSSFLKVSTNFLEALFIVVIGGVYLAARPTLYRDGLIRLFPPRMHARAAETIDGIGEALQLWLLGQLIQMVLIGLLVTLAVWLIRAPSPLALGLIAGVGEFIPYLGPILAAIPAILVALTKSPETAGWMLLAYLIIHQIEGQLVTPLVQSRMVFVPPAVMLLGIAALNYLFGTTAIMFAAPITVVIFAAVNLLYVRDTLGEETELARKLR